MCVYVRVRVCKKMLHPLSQQHLDSETLYTQLGDQSSVRADVLGQHSKSATKTPHMHTSPLTHLYFLTEAESLSTARTGTWFGWEGWGHVLGGLRRRGNDRYGAMFSRPSPFLINHCNHPIGYATFLNYVYHINPGCKQTS